jgi:hypothetical protein
MAIINLEIEVLENRLTEPNRYNRGGSIVNMWFEKILAFRTPSTCHGDPLFIDIPRLSNEHR